MRRIDMKEKYRYKSTGYGSVTFSVILMISMLAGCVILCENGHKAGGMALVAAMFVLMIVSLLIPSYYVTDATSVTFCHLFTNTRIEFGEIRNMTLGLRSKKVRTKYGRTVTLYYEEFVIATDSREYRFCAWLDGNDPGKLEKLKMIIESSAGYSPKGSVFFN